MKKTILVLMLLGIATGLYAGPITPEKALKVAEKVLSVQPVTKSASTIRIIWDGETAATKAAGEDPAFYVVGRDGGGFVIVAGNDNVRPVLALSYTNRFEVEGMPANVRYWMDKIKRYSRSIQEATPEVKAQWEAFEETKGEVIPDEGVTGKYFPKNKPTVEWGQEEPGSSKLPTASGDTEHAVSGCVAIAMAEIMTWFKYPESGTGTVSGYTSQITINNVTHTAIISEHPLETVYNWDGMELLTDYKKFRAEKGTELGNNIAQLVYDIGTILQLNYSSALTGGNAKRAATKLSEHMGYSKAAIERSVNDYPMWQWNEMLKEQVDEHPLYYRGADPNDGSGHAYVIDGYGFYSGSIVFHFNFGWDGLCNGYYSSDYQKPYDYEDIRDEGFGEYHDVSAMFDFVPDESQTSNFVLELDYLYNGGVSGSYSGNGLSIYANYIHNPGNYAFSGKLALFYVDKNGDREEDPIYEFTMPSEYLPSLPAGYNFYGGDDGVYLTLSLAGTGFEVGDKLAYYYKPEGGTEYKIVGFKNKSLGLEELALAPAAFIKTEASYAKNDYFYFRLTNHDVAYPHAVWYITDPDGNDLPIMNQDDDRVQLTKSGKYKIKVTPVEGGESIVAVINVN